MSDLSEMFAALRRCCLHDPQWLPEDVELELAWVGDRATGSESSSIVVVELKGVEMAYGLLTQSEDFTGHGCMCGSMTVREPTLGAPLAHLADHELLRLIRHE